MFSLLLKSYMLHSPTRAKIFIFITFHPRREVKSNHPKLTSVILETH